MKKVGQHYLASGHVADCEELVRLYHYSGFLPTGMQVCASLHETGGLFGDLGRAVAACCYGPGNVFFSADKVLELRRLVKAPGTDVQLSRLISQTYPILKNRGICLLISYADPEQGHHGGIYQASSWQYGGPAGETRGGFAHKGKVYHRRAWRSFEQFVADVGNGKRSECEIVRVAPKLFYWHPLNKEGRLLAAQMRLKSLAYEKPNRTQGTSAEANP
jgi:hypothetical protein